ncbi:hypothetical protein Dsin_014230 [Dipteronia sinensis]|uniref:Apple domain-containing protein n=1 Tax=Dipteronia sinensis TaxID=43782 RepID=A0AAE0AMG5_9ROSI|nr:hypothetical protein Dsin_014230 [Dipteronia sinensis]
MGQSLRSVGGSVTKLGVNSRRAIPYFALSQWLNVKDGSSEYFKFNSGPETEECFAYLQTIDLHVAKSSTGGGGGGLNLARLKYNCTLSFLRLKIDENLEIEIQVGKLSANCQGGVANSGCFDDNQCVACPSENGTLGWSKHWEAEKLNSCGVKDFHYYKLEGVDQFMSKYTRGNGTVKVEDCGKKCTSDCKCMGYFYHQET